MQKLISVRWIAPFSILLGLTLLNTPPAYAASGVIKTPCKFSHFAQVDPIVQPGVNPSAHNHTFFGNVTTNENSTYGSMIGQPTTCNKPGQTSAYWQPTLLQPNGTPVPSDQITAYYRDWPVGSQDQTVTPYPPDFRMVAGYPDPSHGASISSKYLAIASNYGYQCNNTDPLTQTIPNCTVSGRITFVVAFPSCGVRDANGNIVTDSPDHRSHVVFPGPTGCPPDHPVKLPFLYIKQTFKSPFNKVCTGCYLASGGTNTGHADFWNTWDQPTLEGLVQQCLNLNTAC